MNNHTALDWIKMGDLDPIIGKDIFMEFVNIINCYGFKKKSEIKSN